VPNSPEGMRAIAASYLALAKAATDETARNRFIAYAIVYQDLALQIEQIPGLPESQEARING
jgi:hypothetical protein